jgi:tripartite ATP-independent transporter DctP family solute receptor
VSHAVTVHHPGHKAMEKFKEQVEAGSKGQIEVRLFHSSQLAGQREGVEGLQAGSIEITLTPNGVAAAFDPTFALLDIPFQFADAAHARRFLDKGGEKMLFANLDKVGLVGLAAWEQGFRNLATVKAPALKAADMRGLKLRTMEAPLHITAWKAVGANPTPIGWAQVYTSLQQGIIDGVENPSYIFSQTPVHEQLKFLALTKHIYDPILVLGSKAFFDKLPADLRQLVASKLSALTPLEREYVDADVIKAETKDLPGHGRAGRRLATAGAQGRGAPRGRAHAQELASRRRRGALKAPACPPSAASTEGWWASPPSWSRACSSPRCFSAMCWAIRWPGARKSPPSS